MVKHVIVPVWLTLFTIKDYEKRFYVLAGGLVINLSRLLGAEWV